MNIDRYFSISYLIRFGYFDFKHPLKVVEGEYLLYNTFYNKIFNCNCLSDNITKVLGEVDLNFYKESIPIEFSIYKNDQSRRLYKMPNIYSYICLCSHLEKNKSIYIDIIKNSNKSLSKYFYSKSFSESKNLREKNRMGKRYIFKTDIQEFYASIYTHSIPWVLVGKEEAKRNKNNKNIYYNELDSLIQRCQYGETHGIPIGTFASRLISEIYMCKLDKKLDEFTYLRYVDDFEFAYNYEIEQVKFYNKLCKELKCINLKVNINKNDKDKFPFDINNNSSDFFDYFDDKKLPSSDYKYQLSIIHKFIDFSLAKERSGHKGSLKLMFKSLKSAIQDGKLSELSLYKTILERLINLVLMKPDLTGYFLELIDNNSDLKVLDYCRDVINNNREVFIESAKMYIELEYHQELFSILSLLYFLKLNIFDEEILISIIENMDDFNSVIALKFYIERDVVNWKNLFDTIDSKLQSSLTWDMEFWLFKYEFFFNLKSNKKSIFEKEYKDYIYIKYGAGLTKSKFFEPKNLKDINSGMVLEAQNSKSEQKLSNFYKVLMKYNITFLNKV